MRYTIGQLAEIIDGDRGKNYPKQDEFYPQGYCLFLNTGNVTKEGLIFEENQFIMKEKDEALRKGKLKRGDIVYTTRGTVGNAGYYNSSVPYENIRINSGMVILRSNGEIVDARFLYQILKSEYYRPYFKQYCTGSAQPQLPIKNFSQIYLNVPDIKTQHRIADILSAYDDLIENNQKQIKLLEEAAQRLYKEWFVDLRFPGHENTNIVDGVPEGWSKSTVSEVSAVLRRGISPKYNEKARGIVINQKCIRQTIVSYDEARTQEKKYPAELEMMESDIVICSTGAGTLGRVGQIFEAKGNATLDSHVTLIRADEKIGQQSLFWSLKMKQDYLMNAGKGSTNQLELSRETIGNCKILIPERKIAEQAEKNFVAIHNKMKECTMQIARLRETRDLLLPKLMSGEVEV
jgi:type I restriction enzyme S subunit